MKRTGRKPRPPASTPGLDPRGLTAESARYLEGQRIRQRSPRTVEEDGRYLAYFVAWCAERGIERPVEVTLPVLERYQRFLFHYRKRNGKPLSLAAQRSRLSAVRLFFRWLMRERRLLANPAADLELPRLPRRLPRDVLTAEEAELVLHQASVGDPVGLRDRALMEVFYSTGVRRAELAALSVWDVDFTVGTVRVRHGKGGKERMVPIGERALAWLAKYLDQARPEIAVEPDDGTLFLSELGERMEPGTLSHRVRDYVERAGLRKRGACHLFRHTMATLMLEGGADVRFIQEMLGHEHLTTTQIYTHVSIRKLQEIHAATHPAAKLERKSVPRSTDAPAGEDERAALLAALALDDDEASAGRSFSS